MRTLNVSFCGLGGQGVLKASDILADVFFLAGMDVKKSEVHGMSQRGGSVNSDVRGGKKIYSPMIPDGEVDILVVLDETQLELNRSRLKADAKIIKPSDIDLDALENKRSLNVALLGALSALLPEISRETWLEAIRQSLPEKLHAVNEKAFELGRHSID